MNKDLFDYKIKVKSYTRDDIAKLLAINPATLYRKLTGESDFTRREIQMIKDSLQLSNEQKDLIFFTDKVA